MNSLTIAPKSITFTTETADLQNPTKEIEVPPDIFTYIFGFLPLKKVAEIALTSKDICVIAYDYLYSRKIELDIERIPSAKYLLDEIARQNSRPEQKVREFFSTLRVYKNRSLAQKTLNQKFALAPIAKEIQLNVIGVWRNHRHFCAVIAQAIKVDPIDSDFLEDSLAFFNLHDKEIAALNELDIVINEKFYYVPPLIGRCKKLTKLTFSVLPFDDPNKNITDIFFSLCPQIVHLEKLEEFRCSLIPTNFVPLSSKFKKLQLGFRVIDQKSLEWVYSLTHLEELQLWGEGTYFPLTTEIGKLKALKKLEIQASSLPPEIGQLTELEELTVRLPDSCTALPDELGNLTNLTLLDISAKNLHRLPDSLKNLTNLDVFKLYSDHIKRPPDWVYTHVKWTRNYRLAGFQAGRQLIGTGFFSNYGEFISDWSPYTDDAHPSSPTPSKWWRILLAGVGIALIYKLATYFLRKKS
ncbi:MAG: hypothetical protein JSR58_07550 [Verrucomicrobia bacterium]|nr:hypothetical protein [Verrucomicrobiota bacterium]